MPRLPALEPLYAAFAAFRERCLLNDRSLLWPEREVWTIATLEQARRRFVEGFIQGRMTFREKLDAQLGGAPEEVWALFADAFYVYDLPSRTIRYPTKKGWIEWAARRAGLDLPDEGDPVWEPLKLGFATTGQKYNLKHAQIRLLVLLALEIKAIGEPGSEERAEILNTPRALQELLDSLLSQVPLKIDQANDMRNAILYLAFPGEYEPILSNRDKDAIVRHYGARASAEGLAEPLPADRDAALRQVRQDLGERFSDLGRPFDFYLDAREEWKPDPGLERAIAGEEDAERAAGGPHMLRESGPEWIYPPDPDTLRVLETLRLSRNVILSGPPGAGKTYIAQKAARQVAGNWAGEQPASGDKRAEAGDTKAGPPEDYTWWITLHPSYSYEDFVEGLRPRLPSGGSPSAAAGGPKPGEGEGSYEVRPGVFREVAERAARDPRHTYVLVIDEINRANLAKILGELVTLIEDDKRGALSVRLPYSGARFSVPPNLVLLGTMNTADRSIALLDAALRRRFAFVEILPRPELLAGVVIETDEAALRLDDLLRCLNAGIRESLGAEYQVGHSYFLRVARAIPDERLALLDLVWNTQVLPLLEEYFYARRDRLAEILTAFMEEGSDLLAERSVARLHGEDLVVALSRICDGG